MKSITLKESLKLWQMKIPLKEDEHLPTDVLEEVLKGSGSDSTFEHLSLCKMCRQRLWKAQESMRSSVDVYDYVLPLAADTGIPREATWVTENKKYKIEFRRILSDNSQRAVIIVQVQPPFNLEGKTIVVKDANGKELLCGQIGKDGKVAAIVENIDTLSFKEITIS